MAKKLQWTGKTLQSLTLHKPCPLFRRFDLLILLLLFSYSFQWCYETAGVPLQEELEKQRNLEAEEYGGDDGQGVILEVQDTVKVFDSMTEESEAQKEAKVYEQPTEEESWFTEVEKDSQEEYMPYSWQPDFWSVFFLCFVIWLTVLWKLGQHWSTNFKAFLTCVPVDNLKEATLVKAIPRLHRGKSALVPLLDARSAKPSFLFQKIRFEYNMDLCQFEKVKCDVKNTVKSYVDCKGIYLEDNIKEKRRQFGYNKFEIPMPSFSDMYIEQISAPFFVFQIFCVGLWCLEEYWQYSIFSLVMLLGFEATVVTTRRMNIKKLRGMGNKATCCEVFRKNKYVNVLTEELVPGDLIRITGGTGDDAIIPCDCLLLKGGAVVNEATLTGESVPLMKEPASPSDDPLDIKGADKIHTLFGGTKLMESKSDDGKVTCCVLQTGFASSQGKLVRRIEFSTEKVSGNSRDAALLLGFLLCFALVSSGYVLNRGLAEGKRTRFDILLHCILIITSVVPPDLPMQMALAVNTSLAALMALSVFCTEPFRIPLAGIVSICCFDKTGTLTTDKLIAAGTVPFTKEKPADLTRLVGMKMTSKEATLVLGGCHSLIFAAGQIVGDPLEVTSLLSIGWRCSDGVAAPAQVDGASDHVGGFSSQASIKILKRHHFSSALQRMSTIARVNEGNGTCENYALVKGSPEMILTLLKKGSESCPEWYDESHRTLAKEGYRVLAMAYKKIPQHGLDGYIEDRDQAEKDLCFAGFIVYNCRNRKDSKEIITELRESDHSVVMITGDALFTAAHVASEVSIVHSDKSKILLLENDSASDKLVWRKFDDDAIISDFSARGMKELVETYNLCIGGNTLELAYERDSAMEDCLQYIAVFARMRPAQKELVLQHLKRNGHHTLMCGDGTNDVGALKQADIGVALLCGFGDSNVDSSDKDKDATKEIETAGPSALEENKEPSAAGDAVASASDTSSLDLTPQQEAWLKDPMVSADVRKRRVDQMKDLQIIKKDAEARKARNEWFPELMARFELAKKKQEELMLAKGMKLQGTSPSPSTVAAAKKKVAKEKPKSPFEMLEESEIEGQEMVKLGDASIAAPFTSKMPSIRSVIDVIRQGRCTLLTTIQMYQILALNCLIQSYSLSVLYLDGVKYGDKQMTIMGILATICFFCVSRAKPLPRLSPVRPAASIFHPSLFLSLIGQFVLHLSTLVYCSGLAKLHLPEDYEPDINGKFKANIINTVVFLVTCCQQVCVFAVNYKGRPFMQNITENSAFMMALLICAFGTLVCASETLPFLNTWMALVPLVDDDFRFKVLVALVCDFFSAFAWDRLMMAIFFPKVLKYMTFDKEDLKRTVKLMFWAGLVMYFFMPTEEDLEALEQEFAEM